MSTTGIDPEQAPFDPTTFGLEGKVAVVTGAGTVESGIGNGAAVAYLLAGCGARVALIDRDEAAAERTRSLIEAEGGKCEVFLGDVSEEESAAELGRAVIGSLGAPTVLVNNVGIIGPSGTVLDVDATDWDTAMRVNVKSIVLISRWCVEGMARQGAGSIVNVSSTAGLMGGYPNVLYGASKGAVAQLTRVMAANHGAAGIRVNCVAPGMVHTPMVAPHLTPEAREARRRSSLLETEGTAWDVASAILFFAGDMSRWITGVVMPVDAGLSSAIHLRFDFEDDAAESAGSGG